MKGTLLCVLLAVSLLAGCGRANEIQGAATAAAPADAVEQAVLMRCDDLAALCRPVYAANAALPAVATAEDTTAVLDDAARAALWAGLQAAGLPLMTDEGGQIRALYNVDDFDAFWTSVSAGQDDVRDALALLADGSLLYRQYGQTAGQPYCAEAGIRWQNGEPVISYNGKTDVKSWCYTERKNLIYDLDLPDKWELDGHEMLRTAPRGEQEKMLADYTDEYIEPVGYQGNNLFITDWSAPNFSGIRWNDLIDPLYKMYTGLDLHGERWLIDPEMMTGCIPASVFEPAVYHFFDLSADTLRKCAEYDVSRNGYLWRELNIGNWLHNPPMQPEVVQAEEKGGCLILTVNVISLQQETDDLFTHELTLRILPEGKFHYIANRVTAGQEALPRYAPRLDERWTRESAFDAQ